MTKASTSEVTGGRPGYCRCLEPSNFWATSLRIGSGDGGNVPERFSSQPLSDFCQSDSFRVRKPNSPRQLGLQDLASNSGPGNTKNCGHGGAINANYVDDTNNIAIGMVPVRALGLSNDYALDGYGHDITYAGHSLRAGHATSAAIAGASERSIMNQTGHRSVQMVRRYIRDGSLFRENSAGKLGL
jgi:hypothetical protein